MSYHSSWHRLFFIIITCAWCGITASSSQYPTATIDDIEIRDAFFIPRQTVKQRISLLEGEVLQATKVTESIQRLMGTGYYESVTIDFEYTGADTGKVIISLIEKPRIESISVEGNSVIKTEKLLEEVGLKGVQSMSAPQAVAYEAQIQELYAQRGYHGTQISTEFKLVNNTHAHVTYYITEGCRTVVKQVEFEGNHCIDEDVLRKSIFTREYWPLEFLDKAGTYHKDAVEQDKQTITQIYQNNGFLAARVSDVEKIVRPDGNLTIIFHIEEGEIYTISSVTYDDNDEMPAAAVEYMVPLQEGMTFSRDLITYSIDIIKKILSDHGFIYSDVQPSLRPNTKEKTVSIHFNIKPGRRYKIRSINISGNFKTFDNVIRRMIMMREGQYVTNSGLEASKTKVLSLGYFTPETGALWQIDEVDDEWVDLTLLVTEVPTGKLNGQLNFGGTGNLQSPTTSLGVQLSLEEINFAGTGIHTAASVNFSQQDRAIDLSAGHDWLFNKPIFGSVNAFSRKLFYEDFNATNEVPAQRINGGSVDLGYHPLLRPTILIGGRFSAEDIEFNQLRGREISNGTIGRASADEITLISNQLFQSGTLVTFGLLVNENLRNHPIFPTKGYSWNADFNLAAPVSGSPYGFTKVVLDGHFFTPLVENTLIMHLHGFIGYINPIEGRSVPYNELFHIGGVTTVRGFLFGQIGPQLINGSSIGGTKAFVFNAELRFPLTTDASIRGVFFYDGGAGWDTSVRVPDGLLRDNLFEYRHSVGFGIRLTSPAPISIDVGFKLDRKRRRNEPVAEVHMGYSQSI